MKTALLDALDERTRLLEDLALSGDYDHPAWKSSRGMAKLACGKCKLADPNAKAIPSQANDTEMSIPWVISTVNQDCEGDILVPAGCKDYLTSYVVNPVVFFGHQREPLPIGVSRDKNGNSTVQILEDRIVAVVYFHGETEMSRDCYRLAKAGVLSAASVGFLPIKGKRLKRVEDTTLERDDVDFNWPGFIFTDWELKEWSIVGVSCNREAIRLSLDKGVDGEPIGPVMRREIERFAPPKVHQVTSGWRAPEVVLDRGEFPTLKDADAYLSSRGLDSSDYTEDAHRWHFRQPGIQKIADHPSARGNQSVTMGGVQTNASGEANANASSTAGNDMAATTTNAKKAKQIPPSFFKMAATLFGLSAKEVADQANAAAQEDDGKGGDDEEEEKQLPPGAVTVLAFKDLCETTRAMNEQPDVLKFIDKTYKAGAQCAAKVYAELGLGYDMPEEEEDEDDEDEDADDDAANSDDSDDDEDDEDEVDDEDEKRLAVIEEKYTKLTGAHA